MRNSAHEGRVQLMEGEVYGADEVFSSRMWSRGVKLMEVEFI
jgi:hypothetical protein